MVLHVDQLTRAEPHESHCRYPLAIGVGSCQLLKCQAFLDTEFGLRRSRLIDKVSWRQLSTVFPCQFQEDDGQHFISMSCDKRRSSCPMADGGVRLAKTSSVCICCVVPILGGEPFDCVPRSRQLVSVTLCDLIKKIRSALLSIQKCEVMGGVTFQSS